MTVAVNAPGQASFYPLLNNYFGTPRANEYTITIKGTNNDTMTYSAIGGVDTRDYNSNTFTNAIATPPSLGSTMESASTSISASLVCPARS